MRRIYEVPKKLVGTPRRTEHLPLPRSLFTHKLDGNGLRVEKVSTCCRQLVRTER